MKLIVTSIAAALLAPAVAAPADPPATDTVFIQFERDAKGPFGLSTTVFVRVKEGYKCKASQGFLGQKKLATLDKGNPLVSSKNVQGVESAASDQFRILIRAISGTLRCDVVASFSAKAGERYKLTSRSDLPLRNAPSCSADVSVLQDGEFRKIEFNEYSECH